MGGGRHYPTAEYLCWEHRSERMCIHNPNRLTPIITCWNGAVSGPNICGSGTQAAFCGPTYHPLWFVGYPGGSSHRQSISLKVDVSPTFGPPTTFPLSSFNLSTCPLLTTAFQLPLHHSTLISLPKTPRGSHCWITLGQYRLNAMHTARHVLKPCSFLCLGFWGT